MTITDERIIDNILRRLSCAWCFLRYSFTLFVIMDPSMSWKTIPKLAKIMVKRIIVTCSSSYWAAISREQKINPTFEVMKNKIETKLEEGCMHI